MISIRIWIRWDLEDEIYCVADVIANDITITGWIMGITRKPSGTPILAVSIPILFYLSDT